MVWPLTIYWEDGSRPRDDLAGRTEAEAEAWAWAIEHTWPGALAVHVEAPAEDAEGYEVLDVKTLHTFDYLTRSAISFSRCKIWQKESFST